MRNFRLDLRYDGTDFAGWQLQPGRRTVQGEIERALRVVLPEEVRVGGSGRTDSGVHALRQVAQFRSETALPVETIGRALRGLLPSDLLLLSIAEAPPEFRARGDAIRRSYRYRILRGRDPFLRRYVWERWAPLSLERMEEASRSLAGEIDATSFADASRKRMSNLVRVETSAWREEGPEILYEIRANRFVHHMVRTIVGTLVEIGRGVRPADTVPSLIAARDRRLAGPTAPARGLYLVDVAYAGDEAAGAPLGGDSSEVLP